MPDQRLSIRGELRPGDVGDIVRLHGACYSSEYGLDVTFESYVAGLIAQVMQRGWPEDGEGIWIAEREGRMVGCVALTDEGEGRAQLRWFIVDPAERGTGLGRRMLAALLDAAKAHGHRNIELVTFSELGAAARLYTDAGFRLVASAPKRQWGRTLEMQRYELDLDPAAIRGAA